MEAFDFSATLTNMFDGFVENAVGNAILEYNENLKYPSITSLSYAQVPDSMAKELANAKTSLFGLGVKKHFLESIVEGKTSYAEVLVLARTHRVVDRSQHDSSCVTYQYFYKIADLEGNVLREDVPMIDDKYSLTLEMNGGNSSSDTGNADQVDPYEYKHMFLLQYDIKGNQHQVLLTEDQFEDMSLLIRYADSNYLYAEDGVGYIW